MHTLAHGILQLTRIVQGILSDCLRQLGHQNQLEPL